jgi:hypothetical protein
LAKQNNDLTLKVGFDIDKFQAEINKTTGVLNKWASGVQNSVLGVAAGFSALAIGEFVLDVSRLAGEAEGVRLAFDKLPNSIMLMKELKDATSGTVSELELMKRSVMAQNFGINIEALPKLLEFAAVRAKQTGQSVSYLADSIVTGIGRKSALILDNLGISLAAINEELKVTPDYAQAVGNIAERELAKMGGMSENASTKLERLNASWVNMKVALGEAANGTGVLGTALDGLTTRMDLLASRNLSFLDKLLAIANPMGVVNAAMKDAAMNAQKLNEEEKKREQVIKEVDRAMASGNAEAYINAQKQHIYYAEIFAEYQSRLPKKIELTTEELEKQRKALEALNKKLFEQSELERSIRIAKLDRSQQGEEVSPMAQYANDLDAFVTKTAKIKGAMQQMSAPVVDFGANLQKLGLVAIDVGTIMQQGLVAGVTGFAEAFGQAVAGVGNFGDAIINSLLGFAKTVGNILVQAGAAVLVTKKWLVANPGLAIAAGAALIAIAAGAQSKLRSATSSMGGGSAGGGGGGASSGSRTENLGQRIELQVAFTGDAGKVLKAQMIKQDRIDSRTRS